MTNKTLRIPLHPHFSREKPLLTYPSSLSLRNSLFALDVSHLVVALQSVRNLSYSRPYRKRSKDGTPWSHCSYSSMLWKAHKTVADSCACPLFRLAEHRLPLCKWAFKQETCKRNGHHEAQKEKPFILNFRVISEAKSCEIWFRLKSLPLYLRQEVVCALNSEP